jgi:hypothetical protein
MKPLLIVVALAAATAPALAADVGVSISIGQPGFYGRLDIGDYPSPQLVYQRPRVIEHAAFGRPPIYLRVPPGHAKNWRKHCREYNACGERVFFVRDDWYNRVYVPRYQERHGDRRDGRRDERRDERHDERGNDHHGDHGNDHRNGNRDHGPKR